VVPSSPRHPLSNDFAGVPETTITSPKQTSTTWDYTAFGKTAGGSAGPDETFNLKFEKVPDGRGGLQSLDHQWKVVTRNEPAVHGD
jgi:hypothetical protein